MAQIEQLIPQIKEALMPVLAGIDDSFVISIRRSKEGEITVESLKQAKTENETGKRELQILLPDGAIIKGKNATETLILGIKKAGVLDVAGLNIICNKLPLVYREIVPQYAKEQKEIQDGYYVFTHSSTDEKRKQLIKISDGLNKGWSVSIV